MGKWIGGMDMKGGLHCMYECYVVSEASGRYVHRWKGFMKDTGRYPSLAGKLLCISEIETLTLTLFKTNPSLPLVKLKTTVLFILFSMQCVP